MKMGNYQVGRKWLVEDDNCVGDKAMERAVGTRDT